MSKQKGKTELDLGNDLTENSPYLNNLATQINLLSKSTLPTNLINSAVGLQSNFESINKYQSLLSSNNLISIANSSAMQLYSSSVIKPIISNEIMGLYSKSANSITTGLEIQASLKTIGGFTSLNNNAQYLGQSVGALPSSFSNIIPLNIIENNNLSTNSNILKGITSLAGNFSKLEYPALSTNNALLGSAAQVNYDKTLKFLTYAEKSVLGITSQNFGSKINIKEVNKSHIIETFSTLAGSYSTIKKSFENPILYGQLDSTFAKLAPIEYFSTANLVESISVDEKSTMDEEVLKSEVIYENEISLIEYLPKFDTGLYNMWKGAVETLNSTNSDKIRQFITSIRELFTHLFQKLAPDKNIKAWTNNPEHFFNGRPTRKTRLLYIFRNINDKLFADFLHKDIETTIALIDVFQKGTHSINSTFSEHQLIAIKSKSESTLKFILEIHFKTNP